MKDSLAMRIDTKPRALVIEDERLLQMIHRKTLELMGFDVVVVDHPQKAMELWAEPWDLIFSDIGLPEMFGTELCKLRRQYEEQHGIGRTPSFAYTAFGNTMRDECLAAGFDAFGVKPMDNYELYLLLQNLLPQFELHPLAKIG